MKSCMCVCASITFMVMLNILQRLGRSRICLLFEFLVWFSICFALFCFFFLGFAFFPPVFRFGRW